MEPILLFNNEILTIVLISFIIFLSRVFDVSLGTLRVIYISRGFKVLAPALGFIEVIVWLIVVQQIFTNLTNFFYYIAYAGGFSFGTYVGIILEEKLSDSKVILQIITKRNVYDIESKLIEKKYNITSVEGINTNGDGVPSEVKILYVIVKKKKVNEILDIITTYDKDARYSVEDVRYAKEDYEYVTTNNKFGGFGFFRKGK